MTERVKIITNHIIPANCSNNSSNSNNNNNNKYSNDEYKYASPLVDVNLHELGKTRRKNENAKGSDYTTGLPNPMDNGEYPTANQYSRAVTESIFTGHSHLFRQKLIDKNGFGNNVQMYFYDSSVRRTSSLVAVVDLEDAIRLIKEHPMKYPSYEATFLGMGILSQTNLEQWDFQRNHLKHAFSIRALSKLVPIFSKGAEAFAEEAHMQMLENGVVNTWDLLSSMTFLMIGHSALGEEDEFLSKNSAKLRMSFETTMVAQRGSKELLEAQQTMRDFADNVFRRASEREKSGNSFAPDSLIGLIMAKDPQSGKYYYPPAMRHDELMTFMFAGHETTANTLSWILYEVAKHPEVQKKIITEIDEIMEQLSSSSSSSSQGNNQPTALVYKDLLRFKYLNKVINEAMRLWPVVANGVVRQLMHDDIVHDKDGKPVTIQSGTAIFFPHYAIHRNPKIWGSDANEFKPERVWHEKAFMPFTRPPRDCLGRNMANAEIRVVLITIFQRFTIARGWHESEEDENDQGFNSFTLRPRYGCKLKFYLRKVRQYGCSE